MNNEFAIAEVMPGKLNALVKNLMRQMNITDPEEAVRRINSGEWFVSELWHEAPYGIYFSVISDGTTGKDWIKRLKDKGRRVDAYAEKILGSTQFKPTTGVLYQVALFKGIVFTQQSRNIKYVRDCGESEKCVAPNPELACLIREKFTDEQIIHSFRLCRIVVLHEPIKNSGDSCLLTVNTDGDGSWLDAYTSDPGASLPRGYGFALIF
jgi:hypothetical protein